MIHQFNNFISDEDIRFLEKEEELFFPTNEDYPKSDRQKILKSMKSIDVQACPGSGKTTLIAAKLILLARKWPLQHQGICVISHTNVAKNEIINRLKNSKIIEARRLIDYPHFIGTIQDFIDRFLALPFVRQNYCFTKFLDSEEGKMQVRDSGKDINDICKSLYNTCNKANDEEIKNFLGSIFWLNAYKHVGFYKNFGVLKKYKNDPNRKLYPKLASLKNAIIEKGYFQYRDMYSYAEQLILENASISVFLQKRFPMIFIDEMQDTQKFQDELLQKIFPLDNTNILVQRFGDPDQAIFNNINGEEANISYNSKIEMDFVINQSHRFDDSIANKARGLSYNSIQLKTELSEDSIINRKCSHSRDGNFKHTVFIYDNSTIGQVIEEYAELVSEQFSEKYKKSQDFIVKVVGAVGKNIEKEDDLKIVSYWSGFDKNKSKNSFKADSLVECVHRCRNLPSSDWATGYKLINECVIKMLSKANIKDGNNRLFNFSTFKEDLKKKVMWEKYRKFLFWALERNNNIQISQRIWGHVEDFFKKWIRQDSIPEGLKYISYTEAESGVKANWQKSKLTKLSGNVLKHEAGFNIEFSTIHGVKGETHDATLVLETKNYYPDLSVMIPTPKKPNAILSKKFMRQLYVAMSRPKHLLCLAIHKDRVDENAKKLLKENGWNIIKIKAEES